MSTELSEVVKKHNIVAAGINTAFRDMVPMNFISPLINTKPGCPTGFFGVGGSLDQGQVHEQNTTLSVVSEGHPTDRKLLITPIHNLSGCGFNPSEKY